MYLTEQKHLSFSVLLQLLIEKVDTGNLIFILTTSCINWTVSEKKNQFLLYKYIYTGHRSSSSVAQQGVGSCMNKQGGHEAVGPQRWRRTGLLCIEGNKS